MPTVIAALLAANPNTHGDTMTQRPTIRFSHSSYTANAVSAAIERATITMPLM